MIIIITNRSSILTSTLCGFLGHTVVYTLAWQGNERCIHEILLFISGHKMLSGNVAGPITLPQSLHVYHLIVLVLQLQKCGLDYCACCWCCPALHHGAPVVLGLHKRMIGVLAANSGLS